MIPRAPQEWINSYVNAGVRVVIKRALRAADLPFHPDECNEDLFSMAQKVGADVEAACDEWVEISDTAYGLTQVQRFLMMKSAQQCLLMFRGQIPIGRE